jgi:predicted nuclease with TOPRIM domain
MIDEKNILDGKDLKRFKEQFKITKEKLKEQIPEIETLIERMDEGEAKSSATKGLNELKLAHSSLYEKN